jgi:catalase
LAASGPGAPSPSPLEAFLGAHPAALDFVQRPKPSPASFATEAFFGVTAMRFINHQGIGTYGRYRIVPGCGVEHLGENATKGKDPNYLFDELPQRLLKGPIAFQIDVQTANDGDIVDDATIHWPEDRPVVSFGTVLLNDMVTEQEAEQKKIIFDPIPRVEGIEPSADPLLELRAAIYLLSGRRRRAA